MDIPVTAITAGLLALIFSVLSLRVIRLRRENKISLGDGGNEELRRAARGHANFSEYAPLGVLLILIAELQSVNMILLAVVAAALLAGRAMHGYAFAFTTGNMPLRSLGLQLTLIVFVLLALTNMAMPILGWVT